MILLLFVTVIVKNSSTEVLHNLREVLLHVYMLSAWETELRLLMSQRQSSFAKTKRTLVLYVNI